MPLPARPLFALAALLLCSSTASAFPDFMKQFINVYASDADSAYTATAKEAKCFVCHQGKSKKNRNAYGEALHEYLHKPDRKDVEKIRAALATVAEQSSDPSTEGAPTFGELIAAGKLPGGTLEDVKAEPAE